MKYHNIKLCNQISLITFPQYQKKNPQINPREDSFNLNKNHSKPMYYTMF